jgi:hypothetical protein
MLCVASISTHLQISRRLALDRQRSERPNEVLIHYKRRTRPRQYPQRVGPEAFVKGEEAFVAVCLGDQCR